jgi:hypothetical protein
MSSTATSFSTPASATSSSDPNPARHRRAAVPSEAIGIARPIKARRSPTFREASIDSIMRSALTSPMRSNSSSRSRVNA